MILPACGKVRHNEISSIGFATGYCHGECAFSALSVDSSLKYNYFGGDYAQKKGFYTGRISKEFWDTLNVKLEELNYKQLDSAYQHTVDDQSMELIIHYGNRTKHVRAQSGSLPDSLIKMFIWLAHTYKKVRLENATGPIRFETTEQELQIPPRSGPMFPPPVRNLK